MVWIFAILIAIAMYAFVWLIDESDKMNEDEYKLGDLNDPEFIEFQRKRNYDLEKTDS